MERWLFLAQRIAAMILAPLVIVHLGLILIASRDGLSGAEILSRTQGHYGFLFFYLLFVIAISVHVPLGLRNILREWANLSASRVDFLMAAFALLLLVGGLRAVAAVF